MSNEVSSKLAAIEQKRVVRQQILTARKQKSARERMMSDANLAQQVGHWLQETMARLITTGAVNGSRIIVAAHIPCGDEPGASMGEKFIQIIQDLIYPGQLLLPICPAGPPTALQWGIYTSALTPGKYGLLEPDCSSQGGALGAEAIGRADIVLLPGLAGDAVTGMRMGRGAGYYDRSLALIEGARPATALLLHPEELITGVPFDVHDQPVDAIITANGVHIPTMPSRPE